MVRIEIVTNRFGNTKTTGYETISIALILILGLKNLAQNKGVEKKRPKHNRTQTCSLRVKAAIHNSKMAQIYLK